MPSRRGQEIAIWSTPKRPKRSITAPITSWPAIRIPIVAVAPIRGCANVIVSTMSRPIAPPAHIHRGASNAPPSPPMPAPRDEQDRERQHELDAGREGRAPRARRCGAEAAHHRDLHRAGEPGEHASAIASARSAVAATDSSLSKRPKPLPSVSVQCANQPTCGSASSPRPCRQLARTFVERRVEIVGVEVREQLRRVGRDRRRRPGRRRCASSSTPSPSARRTPSRTRHSRNPSPARRPWRQLEVHELSGHLLVPPVREVTPEASECTPVAAAPRAERPGTLLGVAPPVPPRSGRRAGVP